MEVDIDDLKNEYIGYELLNILKAFEESKDEMLHSISREINIAIEQILEPIKDQTEQIKAIEHEINKLTLDINEAIILYYMYNMCETIPNVASMNDLCNIIENHSQSDFSVSLKDIQTMKNGDCNINNFYSLIENEYAIDNNEDDLNGILVEINRYADVTDWIHILNDVRDSDVCTKIIVLDSMIEPLSDTLHIPKPTGKAKNASMKCKFTDWKSDYNMYATEAAQGIIAINILFARYEKGIKTFIPNRNIITHEGVIYYKSTYDKTYNLLIDFIYKTLNFRLQQYKYEHNIS